MERIRQEKQLSYSAINTLRSALFLILIFPSETPFGQQKLVTTYLKGVYNLNTSEAKYQDFWDPNIVLVFLRSWSPAGTLGLKQLVQKVLMLMLLVSGQRLDTIFRLEIGNLTCGKFAYTFIVDCMNNPDEVI